MRYLVREISCLEKETPLSLFDFELQLEKCEAKQMKLAEEGEEGLPGLRRLNRKLAELILRKGEAGELTVEAPLAARYFQILRDNETAIRRFSSL